MTIETQNTIIARRIRIPHMLGLTLGAGLIAAIGYGIHEANQTRTTMTNFAEQIKTLGRAKPNPQPNASEMTALPDPVQRYFAYTFPDGPQALSAITFSMEGQFRRPGFETFAPTTASQTVATGEPALIFAGQTPIISPIWAIMYDAYIEGRMEMKARIMSAITVMDEKPSKKLDRISLRRWLLESPVYPEALLPGGPVTWQAIDDTRARATVTYNGLKASLIATFRANGSLKTFQAEEDGDMKQTYHGSGEYVLREDYQLIAGARRPMRFIIARKNSTMTAPFWIGRINNLTAYDQQGKPAPTKRKDG